MNPSQNLARAHTHRHSCKSFIHQMQDSTLLCFALGHDGRLSSRIDKGLNIMTVYFGGNIQHEYPSHGFWIELHHVAILSINFGLCFFGKEIGLCFLVVGIRIESSLHFRLLVILLRSLQCAPNAALYQFFSPNTGGRLQGFPAKLWRQVGGMIIELLVERIVLLNYRDKLTRMGIVMHGFIERHAWIVHWLRVAGSGWCRR
mmetsp:Transcript_8621/g.15614  ORF Transcript_8621/g.15614 Transcript_8621/m.15614 type:complete len:202 (+) Transcript_8621:440-1045(+)